MALSLYWLTVLSAPPFVQPRNDRGFGWPGPNDRGNIVVFNHTIFCVHSLCDLISSQSSGSTFTFRTLDHSMLLQESCWSVHWASSNVELAKELLEAKADADVKDTVMRI